MDFALALWGAAVAEPTLWTTAAKVTLNIAYVILGINALIIVHEFGHFAVARLCGVRCEKFYIWFDFWGLKFFKFKWGDTEYGLGVFPLGGYVKMLGQEDNPGELRAEMERAREQKQGAGDEAPAQSPDDAPAHSIEELNEAIYSPDSYLAKSVPQRMAIIVAGVVMNFLFAILCGAGAYLVGFKEVAPVIGGLVPGAPAWESGLEVGDRIAAVGGAPVRSFMDINMAMVGAEDGILVEIERPGRGGTPEKIEKRIFARKRGTDLSPMLGITSSPTLEIARPDAPTRDWMPVFSGTDRYFAPDVLDAMKKQKLVVDSVEGTPVGSYVEYRDEQLKRYGRSISCAFRPKDGNRSPGESDGGAVELSIPAIPMKEIGIRFRPGPITMVLPGSDAGKKGIKPGDVIVRVDGDPEYDPMKLPQIVLKKLNEDATSVELGLRTAGGEERTVSVDLAPIRSIPELSALSMKDPLGSTALGLSWGVEPIVAAAEDETVPTGGKVVSIKFVHSIALLGGTTFTKKEKDGFLCMDIGGKIDMPYILGILLQEARSEEPSEKEKKRGETRKTVSVRLEIEKPDGSIATFDRAIADSKDWFAVNRGIKLQSEMALTKVDDLGEALKLGTDKMVEYSLSVFKFLRHLVSGGISPKALGGPVTIVRGAYMFVEKGFGSYLLFLCLIGANLAVINILPIPVLDGGHLVFLLYEGIFRRPPNETVQVVLSYIGLFLILLLMVWAISLDIGCIKRF